MTVTASQYLFELAIARSTDQIIHSSTHSPFARGFPPENWAWHPIDEYVQVLRVHQAWEVWRGSTSHDLQNRKWVFRWSRQLLVKKIAAFWLWSFHLSSIYLKDNQLKPFQMLRHPWWEEMHRRNPVRRLHRWQGLHQQGDLYFKFLTALAGWFVFSIYFVLLLYQGGLYFLFILFYYFIGVICISYYCMICMTLTASTRWFV